MSMPSSQLKQSTKTQRREDRARNTLPLKVSHDNGVGVTRDLSVSGVYFETSSRYHAGSVIKMTIAFDGPAGMQLECEGTIVRVEDCGPDKVGIAVSMTSKALRRPIQK
jgi:hypothetical protein